MRRNTLGSGRHRTAAGHDKVNLRPKSRRIAIPGLVCILFALVGASSITATPAFAASSTCTPCAFSNVVLPSGASIAYQNCTKVVQLTTTIGDDSPSISPDGRSVAFRRTVAGISEIYITSTTPGGIPTKVTNFGSYAAAPTWSPDSSQLAVEVMLPNTLNAIYKINLDGSGATLLRAGGQHPSWCRNGRIAYTSSSGLTRAIHTLDASDGGNDTTLTSGGVHSNPAWSPDCKWIFYDS